jgi:hypothetical protein
VWHERFCGAAAACWNDERSEPRVRLEATEGITST